MVADVGRAFGTVITVGAGVVALDMMSRLGESTRKGKSKPLPPSFTLKDIPSKQYSFKPIRWKL